VSELADENMRSSPVPGCYGLFGSDLRTDAWYYVSPISFVDAIACPVLVQVATGDMLVPHGQATKRFPRPFDPDLFPAGYQRDFETLTLNPKARRTLEDALGDKKVAFHRVRLPEGIYEFSRAAILGQESPPEEGPEAIDRPWDKDAQWNIAVYDEGPPLPHSAHSRYDWRCSPDSFVAAHQKAERPVGLLTPGKLERLMERYTGQYEHQPVMADGTPANRLNYPILEQLDVVTGLLDYAASGPAHAERLAEIYANGRRKPFGKKVDLDDLRVRREQLEEALNP